MSFSPTLGRFLERDPMEYVDGPNLYQFTRSNPVTLTDPFGTYPPGHQGARPTVNDPGPDDVGRALYINVVPELDPKQGNKTERAIEDAKNKKPGKVGDRAIAASAFYADYVSCGDYTLRTTSAEDMIRQLKDKVRQRDPKLKNGNAIRRLVIRSHGFTEGFWIGNKSGGTDTIDRWNIDPSDLAYNAKLVEELQSLRGYFTEDAEIILWTCYTGQDQEFLQRLADITGVKVSALTSKTNENIFTLGLIGDWKSATPGRPTTQPAR
jgi:hypothetical protein